MPTPKEGESRSDYVARCVPYVIKNEGIEQDAAVGKCEGMYSSHHKKKEIKQFDSDIVVKEVDGEFYSEGWIATTHPDRSADSELGVDGDILSLNVLKQITNFINKGVSAIDGGVGSPLMVSDMHDWIKERDASLPPAGAAVPPAVVKEYEDSTGKKDGHWGAFVKTHHNKNYPRFKELLYDVEHKYKPGYSIEYSPGEFEVKNLSGHKFRFLKTINNFVGYAFASARKIANPMAMISGMGYKEIEDSVETEKFLLKKRR